MFGLADGNGGRMQCTDKQLERSRRREGVCSVAALIVSNINGAADHSNYVTIEALETTTRQDMPLAKTIVL